MPEMPIFVIALACLVLYPVLFGEFLYDDFQVLLTSESARALTGFSELPSYVVKPTRPLADLLLGIGILLSPSKALGSRVISLLMHLGNGLMIYFWCRRMLAANLTRCSAAIVSLLFLLSPLAIEALSVAVFRTEILGTFFTLLAGILFFEAERQDQFSLVLLGILSILFAGMCKEPYLLVSAVAALIATKTNRKRITLFVLTAVGFETFLLVRWSFKDTVSGYPYRDFLGGAFFEMGEQASLASRALLEGLLKAAGVLPLTFVKLRDRFVGLSQVFVIGQTLLATGLLVFIARLLMKRKNDRCFGIYLTGFGVALMYLITPNLNVGSEHYWYFPLVGVALFAGQWASQIELKPMARMALSCGMMLVVVLSLSRIRERLQVLPTRLGVSLQDAQRYPESASAWNNVAVGLLETDQKAELAAAGQIIEYVKKISPQYLNIHLTEWIYLKKSGQTAEAEKRVPFLRDMFRSRPDLVARLQM